MVELMACPGGCIGGGGQPYPQSGHSVFDPELLKLRASALYSIDEAKTLRKSHENPDIQKLYEEYLKQPGSELAHKLLHTRYTHRFPRGI
jgi:iron only hydrogenase large subunit-like protein